MNTHIWVQTVIFLISLLTHYPSLWKVLTNCGGVASLEPDKYVGMIETSWRNQLFPVQTLVSLNPRDFFVCVNYGRTFQLKLLKEWCKNRVGAYLGNREEMLVVITLHIYSSMQLPDLAPHITAAWIRAL